jgi:hypothetical protein
LEAIAGVYSLNYGNDRRLLWDDLAWIINWWNLPWCIGGDFNVIRFPIEKLGEVRLCSTMRAFSDFISDQGLMDLPLVEGFFTWSLSWDPPVWSRIDCFLVYLDWEARFPMVSHKRLSRLYSDHFSILLDCGDVSKGSIPFKFENMWLKAKGFVGLMKHWWDSYSF